MTTRLNTLTTQRYELRAKKTRRNREAALNAFIGKKAEIDEMLARLQALSDDHFNCAYARTSLSGARPVTATASRWWPPRPVWRRSGSSL